MFEIITNFSNREKAKEVKEILKDFMNEYYTKFENKQGLVYKQDVSFSDKDKMLSGLVRDAICEKGRFTIDATDTPNEIFSKLQEPTARFAYFSVVNEFIDMIIPEIIQQNMGVYSDVRSGNWGDNFVFDTEPNHLFAVSKAGRDKARAEVQSNNVSKVSITPFNHIITVGTSLFKTLVGTESMAKFVSRAILSIEVAISQEAFTVFNTAMGALPTTPDARKLNVAGYSEKELMRLCQTVQIYNGNAKPVILGTMLAVQDLIPTAGVGRYDVETSNIQKIGYIPTFKGYDVMVLAQVADFKNKYKLFLPDDKLYILSPASQKILKICFEGTTVTRDISATNTADLTETTTLNKSWGMGIATNAIAAQMTLGG